jgi:hypothetical protein
VGSMVIGLIQEDTDGLYGYIAMDADTTMPSIMEIEPILAENPQRFCMFPIKYESVWEMYKKATASFWTGMDIISIRVCW